MNKQCILFDHDGVLVDTEQWYFKANQRLLADYDIDLDLNIYMDIMINGRSCMELLDARAVQESKPSELRTTRDSYYQEYLKTENIEIPGVEAVLKRLYGKYKMAIVTTSMPNDFQVIQENMNIVSYMDFVLTRDSYARAKPHPEPYLLALERLRCSPQNAIVVEDSQRGLQSAVAAGVDCAIVHNEFTESHDFSKATYYLKSLSELIPLLDSLG